MITIDNYNTEVKKIDWSKVSPNAKTAREGIEDIMEFYNDDDDIKETIDLYFNQISKGLVNKKTVPKNTTPKSRNELKAKKQQLIDTMDIDLGEKLDTSILRKYAFLPKHPLMILDKKSPQFKEAFNDFLVDIKKYGNKSPDGDWELLTKASKKQGEPKYKGLKVGIIEDGRYYIVWDIEKDVKFANKKFKSATLAKKFITQNGMVLVNKPTKTKKETPCQDAIDNFLDQQQSSRAKASAKRERNKVKNLLDEKTVDNLSKEFALIRRAYNLVSTKGKVTFRRVQLLYMAFQKAIISRDVRKTSSDAVLFNKVNKKIVAIYEIANPNPDKSNGVDIEFTDKALLKDLETYSNNRKVDYSITLLKSYIGMQGTKPEVKKAENLLKRITNAIDNGRVDKRNRLWSEIEDAKKELKSYIKEPTAKLDVEVQALSKPLKKKTLVNKRKSSVKKKIKSTKVNPPQKKKHHIKKLGTILIDVSTPTPLPVVVSEGTTTATPLDVLHTPQEPVQKPTTLHNKKPIQKNKLVQGITAAKNSAANSEYFKLTGPLSEFLGKLEKKTTHSLVITLDAPPGSGKTRALFQMFNMAANAGLTGIFWSLEEHPESKVFSDKTTMYIDAENERLIDVVGDLPDTYNEFLKIIEQYDFIGIDSWNKAYEKYGVDFDSDLRKKLNGKLIVAIFQRTGTGTMRGGSKAGFDGDVILEVIKDADFKNSYLQARKNRYQDIPLNEIGYNFYHKKVFNPDLENTGSTMPTQMII